jgi:hypothetical protein
MGKVEDGGREGGGGGERKNERKIKRRLAPCGISSCSSRAMLSSPRKHFVFIVSLRRKVGAKISSIDTLSMRFSFGANDKPSFFYCSAERKIFRKRFFKLEKRVTVDPRLCAPAI